MLQSQLRRFLGVLLVLLPVTATGQQPNDSVRLDRLAALGRLWATVKYFHPALAHQPIDWDSALIATIPLVNRATDTRSFAAAVQRMLDALDDPVTHVHAAEPPPTPSPRDPDPKGRRLPDGTWLVELHNYADLADFVGSIDRLHTMADSVRHARSVIIDLRTTVPGDDPSVMAVLQFAEFDRLLVPRPIRGLALRGRYYSGFVPMAGASSGGYFGGQYTVTGDVIVPADTTPAKPIVFIVSTASILPPVALALQEAGLARIVAEGTASERAAVQPMQLGLGEGLAVAVRTLEIVHRNGAIGFTPDTVIPVSGDVTGAPALDAAVALAQRPTRTTRLVPHEQPAVEPLAEKTYDQPRYPSAEYRLLAAFRMWAAVRFFYPYAALMGEGWNAVLRAYLPRLEAAGDSLEYALTIAEMWTHIHDSHGFIGSPVLETSFMGRSRPPARVRMIEGQPVVYQLQPDSIGRATGIRIGDVILTVDGEPTTARMARLGRYIPASTRQAWDRDVANQLLRGPDSSQVTVTVRNADGHIRKLTMPRSRTFSAPTTGNRDGPIFRRVSPDIGYVDLDRLSVPMVDSMFAVLAKTRAIIFDMRGYPQGTAWAIAPRLTDFANLPAARFYRLQPMWRDTTEQAIYAFTQTLPPATGPRYRGLTVMLIDERTQSQAEHSGVFFRAANRTRFIGSPTAGANGDVTTIVVPGGIELSFSGQGTGPVDGAQLQRVGLRPDVLVRPTIAGIRAGRDEVLDSAIVWVKRKLAARTAAHR